MKTVFFDVDTQIDFIFPAGALPVPGAIELVPNLAALTRYAAGKRLQVLSTTDAHSEDDIEFKSWPPHCVVDTAGQLKLQATSLPKQDILSTAEGALDWIADDVGTTPKQVIIQKHHVDCFTNPNLRPLLDLLQADRFVVYGVASEVCVQYALFGLLQTGARIELVRDAIRSFDPVEEKELIREFTARGGVLTTTAQVINE